MTLKVMPADGLATIRLCSPTCLSDNLLNRCTQCIGEIASTHHVVALDEFLDLGSNDITHTNGGKR